MKPKLCSRWQLLHQDVICCDICRALRRFTEGSHQHQATASACRSSWLHVVLSSALLCIHHSSSTLSLPP